MVHIFYRVSRNILNTNLHFKDTNHVYGGFRAPFMLLAGFSSSDHDWDNELEDLNLAKLAHVLA